MIVRRRTAFTLVELLVVIGVITVLGGMLLPAVQSAREAARMNTCRNNVSQLSKGLVHHESLLGYFPSSGWGPEWLGVAERASDSSQPGGWVYAVLSYIEEKDLRNSIEGVTTSSAEAAYAKLVTAAIPVFACPSRRTARPLYLPANRTQLRGAGDSTVNPAKATHSDYAINSGSTGPCVPVAAYKGIFAGLTASSYGAKKVTLCHKGKTQSIGLPAVSSAGHADDTLGACESCGQPLNAANMKDFASLAAGDAWRKLAAKDKLLNDPVDMGIPDTQDGISFRMSRLQAASVLDGLSNTYLVGEKYVAAGTYELGTDEGDSLPMMVGYSSDIARWGFVPPMRDTRRVSSAAAFGSGHAGGWNVAYADGMVRTVAFEIDATVHQQLSSRNDGKGMPPQ